MQHAHHEINYSHPLAVYMCVASVKFGLSCTVYRINIPTMEEPFLSISHCKFYGTHLHDHAQCRGVGSADAAGAPPGILICMYIT